MISGRPPPGADPATGPMPAPAPIPLPTTDSGVSHDFDRATISASFSLKIQHRGLRGWNHRAAIRKKEWILLDNCGQAIDCE